MAITIYNMRIVPYTQKDTIKPVYGNTMELTFVLPEPYALGDEYMLGMDYDRTLVPTVRPICAFTNEYTIDNNEITFRLNLNWQRFRDWVSRIKKPTPVWLQMVRKRNEVYTTLLLDDVLALPSIIDGAGTTFPGDPILDLLDRKMDKTEVEGTDGQVLTMGEDGHYAWADLPEIPEQEQANWDESDSSEVSYIRNKPALFSGDYNDLTNKPTISEVGHTGEYSDLTGKPDLSVYVEKSELADVATTGSYNDLTETPDLSIYVEKKAGKGLSSNDYTDEDKTKLEGIEDNAQVNVQADWDDSDSSGDAYIRNKPSLSTVALTGSYNDLIDKPVIPEPTPQVQADWEESDSSEMSYIKHKPDVYTKSETNTLLADKADKATTLAGYGITDAYTKTEIDTKIASVYRYKGTVATYADLPSSGQEVGDVYNVETADAQHGIKAGDNVAWNGTTWDVLAGEIVFPEQVQTDWDESESSELSYIQNKPDLSIYVEKEAGKGLSSNDFTDSDKAKLNGIENGAEVNVNANWDESDSTEDSFILNKPDLKAVSTTGSYNDLIDKPHIPDDQVQADWDESDSSDVSFIKNKPVIPVVNDATVTINQGGVQKGSFTLNQSGDTTIDLNDGAQSDWDESDSTDVAYIKNKPVIPEQEQADWDESDSSEVSYILNKPNVEPSIDELNTFFYELYDESSSSEEPADHEPLTITMNDPSYSQGIRFFCQFTTSTWNINMQYSYDKETWNDFTFSSEIGNSYSSTVYIGNGYTSEHVYIRGNNNGNYFATGEYFVFNTTENSSINNAVKLSGNLFSIFRKESYWNLTNFSTINTYGQYGCYSLFRNTDGSGRYLNNIIDAGDLIIPALILTPYMCNNMFRATSITRAPYLPSVSPSDSCYASMYYDCSNLQEISVGFFNWSVNSSAFANWVYGVSATGTFMCRASLPTTTTGASGIPTGWTVQYF